MGGGRGGGGGRVMVGRNGGMSPVGLGSLEWDGGRGWVWEEATHDGDRWPE